MFKLKKILCIIPARGGSKRLPGKNIRLLNGRPLISYAIEAAKGSKYIDRIVVSTDDDTIAAVAMECGVQVPFMRPAELALDATPTLPVLQHAVEFFEKNSETVDLIVLIQATVPGVEAEDVDAAIEKLMETGANSCITVCEVSEPPAWMYRMQENGHITPYTDIADMRSQDLEKLYKVNGAVYVMQRTVLMDEDKIIDNANCVAVVMPRERSVDIDTAIDFEYAELMMQKMHGKTI